MVFNVCTRIAGSVRIVCTMTSSCSRSQAQAFNAGLPEEFAATRPHGCGALILAIFVRHVSFLRKNTQLALAALSPHACSADASREVTRRMMIPWLYSFSVACSAWHRRPSPPQPTPVPLRIEAAFALLGTTNNDDDDDDSNDTGQAVGVGT